MAWHYNPAITNYVNRLVVDSHILLISLSGTPQNPQRELIVLTVRHFG